MMQQNLTTIQKLLTDTVKKLSKNSTSAQLDAELLIIEAINSTLLNQRTVLTRKNVVCRTWLYSHSDYKLSTSEIKKFNTLLYRRLKGEPIAYIIGHKEFYDLNFYINRHVLIPRPETEIMVEEVLKILPHYHTSKRDSNDILPAMKSHDYMVRGGVSFFRAERKRRFSLTYPRDLAKRGIPVIESHDYMVKRRRYFRCGNKLKIADIGTGSGCIAIAITKNCPGVKIYASDISQVALKVAKKNARHHQVLSKIKFRVGDLIPWKKQKFDIVLANLPYLRLSQIKNELKFEPRLALDGGKDGLTSYQNLFTELSQYLKPKYLILIEIDPSQIGKLKRIIMKNLSDDLQCRNSGHKRRGDNPSVKVIKDYSGKNRFLKICSQF